MIIITSENEVIMQGKHIKGIKYIWQLSNWSDFTWQSESLLKLLGQARASQSQLLTQVKSLGFEEQTWARQELLLEETMQTASIEGENYQRDSVRSSIIKYLGLPGGENKKTEPQIDGLVQVLLDATQNYHQPLTRERLFSWHAALFPTGYSGLYKIEVGQWRSEGVAVVSGAIGREEIHYEGLPAKMIEREMNKFLSWWEQSEQLDGLLRAAVAHLWFIMIHPFADGNGRLARVLAEMALAQDEKIGVRYYSLSSQLMYKRAEYYQILHDSQGLQTDITAWLEWFLQTFIKAIERSKKIMKLVLEKAEFWQKHGQVELNKRQVKVINKLLDIGRGNFKGGLTTRKYAAITKVSKATAFRELDDLLKKKIIARNLGNKGRNVSYNLY